MVTLGCLFNRIPQTRRVANVSVSRKTRALPAKAKLAISDYERAATSRLEDFIRKVEAVSPPPMLFHYTNDVGLRGILESGTLWLTDIFNLNDPSELRHGLRIAIQLLKGREDPARPEIELFASQLERFDIDAGVEQAGHFFICCFSGDGDDLGQWRAYGDDGRGFALGFEAKSLEGGFTIKNGKPIRNNSTFHITYDDAELATLETTFTDEIEPLISLPRTLSMTGDQINSYMRNLLTYHSLHVIRSTMFFKHEAYRNEREYRFQQLFRRDRAPPAVKLRHRPYSVVRYREFSWRNEAPGALQKIVVGPAADRAKAKQFADDCLREFCAGNTVDVEYSTIPYRSPR